VTLADGDKIVKIGDFGEAKQMSDQKEWFVVVHYVVIVVVVCCCC
jgi:hypothetical protein